MYQNKDHEFSYTFEWCNNGMEIAQAVIDFNHDHDAWNDNRKTSERDFESGEFSYFIKCIPKTSTFIFSFNSSLWFEKIFMFSIYWFTDSESGRFSK